MLPARVGRFRGVFGEKKEDKMFLTARRVSLQYKAAAVCTGYDTCTTARCKIVSLLSSAAARKRKRASKQVATVGVGELVEGGSAAPNQCAMKININGMNRGETDGMDE